MRELAIEIHRAQGYEVSWQYGDVPAGEEDEDLFEDDEDDEDEDYEEGEEMETYTESEEEGRVEDVDDDEM